MMKRHLLIFLAAVALFTHSTAPAAQYYGTELPFTLGADARPSGMGVASAGLLGGASLQAYNPSTMTYLESKQFTFFRTTLFDSRSTYHAASYAHPILNHGTIGISIMRVGVGGIEERDGTNQLLGDDLSSSQTRVLLGYARDLTKGLAAGLNVKIDNQSFAGYGGAGVGLDLGLLASQTIGHQFLKGVRQALVVQNLIEPALTLDMEKVADPRSLTVGAAAISAVGNVHMVTAIDLVKPRFSPLALRVGQEVLYQERYALRIGLDADTPTYGLGVRYRDFAFDYAYRSEEVGGNHRISLSVQFGESRTEQRARLDAALAAQEETIEVPNNQPITVAKVHVPDKAMDPRSLERINDLMRIGIELYNAARFDTALVCFEEVMRIDRGHELAKAYRDNCQISIQGFVHRHVLDAREHLSSGDYEAAIRTMEAALDLEPDNPIVRKELQIYREMQRLRATASGDNGDGPPPGQAQGTVSADRDSMLTSYRRGVVAFNMGDFNAAVNQFRPVWEADPEFQEVSRLLSHSYLLAGMQLYSEGNYRDAMWLWEQVLIVDPGNDRVSRYLDMARQAAATPGDG